jgi:hypothetical protein
MWPHEQTLAVQGHHEMVLPRKPALQAVKMPAVNAMEALSISDPQTSLLTSEKSLLKESSLIKLKTFDPLLVNEFNTNGSGLCGWANNVHGNIYRSSSNKHLVRKMSKNKKKSANYKSNNIHKSKKLFQLETTSAIKLQHTFSHPKKLLQLETKSAIKLQTMRQLQQQKLQQLIQHPQNQQNRNVTRMSHRRNGKTLKYNKEPNYQHQHYLSDQQRPKTVNTMTRSHRKRLQSTKDISRVITNQDILWGVQDNAKIDWSNLNLYATVNKKQFKTAASGYKRLKESYNYEKQMKKKQRSTISRKRTSQEKMHSKQQEQEEQQFLNDNILRIDSLDDSSFAQQNLAADSNFLYVYDSPTRVIQQKNTKVSLKQYSIEELPKFTQSKFKRNISETIKRNKNSFTEGKDTAEVSNDLCFDGISSKQIILNRI